MKIANKNYMILSVVLVVICLSAVSLVIGWFDIKNSSKQLREIHNDYQTKTDLIMNMWDTVVSREGLLQKMLIHEDPFEQDEFQISHQSLAGRFVGTRDTLLSMQHNSVEKEHLNELDKKVRITAPIQVNIRKKIIDGDIQDAKSLIRTDRYLNARDLMFEQFGKVFTHYSDLTRDSLNKANETTLTDVKRLLIITAITILLCGFVGYYMIRKIAIADDDLKLEVQRHIETQGALEAHRKGLEQDIKDALRKYKLTEADRNKSQIMTAALGQILETSLNEIYIFDEQTLHFINVNESARTNLGYTMAELKAMTPIDLKPNMDEGAFHEKLLPLRDGTQMVIEFNTTHKRKDGTTYPIEVHLQQSKLGDRAVFTAIIMDISKRVENERRFRLQQMEVDNIENELDFQKVALSEHAIVCTIDKDEIIQSVNSKYCEISGYAETDVIGSHLCVGLSSEQDGDMLTKLSSTIHQGDIWHGVLCFNRQQGNTFWTKTTITPFRNNDDEIYQFVVVSTDITEQKLIEEQLLKSSAKIQIAHQEVEMAHEELELSHSKMLQSEKLASVGQLAAGIAHEINTPIQFVGDNTRFLQESFSDLMQVIDAYGEVSVAAAEGKATPELISKAKALSEEVEVDYLAEEIPSAIAQSLDGVARISKIVGSMKDFSHPGTDHMENVDLSRSIESTINVSRNEWKYEAEMVTAFDNSLVSVPCYVGELNQVILNIIVNASHAIADCREESDPLGKIVITTQAVDDEVEIRISDSGCGMPDEVKKRIFEPFYTTKGVGKGTGQGLAIAYDVVVDKHNGSMNVESQPGEGTTFIIRLPLIVDMKKNENENDLTEEDKNDTEDFLCQAGGM